MTSTPFQLYNHFNIGIIEDSIDSCTVNFKKLLKKGNLKAEATTKVDFLKVCKEPDLEYSPSERRFLLYEPLSNPNSTIFFPNLVDGWYTAVYNYTRLFQKNAFLVGFYVKEGLFHPAYFFRHFRSTDNEVEERHVHVIKEENKWVYSETSSPLAIEDTNNYKKRKKTDRLNNEIIIDYLKKANYDLTSNAFYQTNRMANLFKYS